MRKKLIAFVTAAMLTFAAVGCNKSENDQSVTYKGRYVEEQIPTSSSSNSVGELFWLNDTASFVDVATKKIYSMNTEKTKFTTTALPNTSSLGSDIYITGIACSSSGEYFLCYYSEDNEERFAVISPNGEITSIPLEGYYLYVPEYAPDGTLYAAGTNGSGYCIFQIDTENQSAKPLLSLDSEICAFDVVDNYIVAVDASEMYFYDYQNDTVAETPEAMRNFLSEQGLTGSLYNFAYDFCSGEDGTFYIVSKKGLYRYVMNGNQVEQLIDGFSCHLSNPAYTVRSVIYDTDGSFLINYEEGAIMRYRYDPEFVNEITSTLNVYSLTENDTLSQIISEYQTQNSSVRVEYEIGMRSGITYDDALKNLTTEILSDNSPDVIMLDGLDIDNYEEKNILLDLSESESTWNPDNALLDNVAKWNDKGGLYSVACKFEMPVVIAWQEDMEKINALSDLADIIEEKYDENRHNPDNYISFFLSSEDIIDTAFALTGGEIVTENGIDETALTQILNDSARIYENRPLGDERYNSEFASAYENSLAPSEKWIIRPAGRGLEMLGDMAVIAAGTTKGFMTDLNLITSLNTENSDITYRYGLTEENDTFIPKCNLGICTTGDNLKEAENFLAVALSENVQDVEHYDGFPVNKNSLQKFYDKNKNSNDFMGIGGVGDIVIRATWMDNTEVAEFEAAIEKLSQPVLLDTMTHDIIIETGTKCMEGTLTPEEAVTEITRQLELRNKE